jgi:hypothetical protein
MCEGGGRGGEGEGYAFYYTYIYSGKRESCEGSELVDVLVAENIHPVCMCEGGGSGGEGGGDAIGPENAVWVCQRNLHDVDMDPDSILVWVRANVHVSLLEVSQQ